MATNLRNFGTVIGRLTANPVRFANSDGSLKIKFTLAVDDNFKTKDGENSVQFVSLEGFISAKAVAENKLGAYPFMEKGDKVGVGYSVKTNNYTDKEGNMTYGQVLLVNTIDLQESAVEKEMRKARTIQRNAMNAMAMNAMPAPAATAPVYQVSAATAPVYQVPAATASVNYNVQIEAEEIGDDEIYSG